MATGGELCHDIRYNLLAVVPGKRKEHKVKCDVLAHNKKVLIELFKKLAHKESFLNDTEAPSILKNPEVFGNVSAAHNNTNTSNTNHTKKVSFGGENPTSPQSSSSSTLTGTESPNRRASS